MSKLEPRALRRIRHKRVRDRVRGTTNHPRLCVFRSLNHIYAQVVDDSKGQTLACASTLEAEVRGELNSKAKTARASLVGSLVAKRALSKGVNQVVFDRGGYDYHGRVKALAEAARQGGLHF